jgi:ferredoxin
MQLYACGSPRYMDGVFDAAARHGWPEDALHREYFSVPEAPPRPNHPFVLKLQRSGRTVPVPDARTATEALAAAGVAVATKCSDGLCGVCATAYDAAASDEVEHRDFVLSRRERAQKLILCCSRARDPGGIVAIDL